MNDILKQRLVGALVLIALGVVFWPVIFVQTERQPLDRTSQVPPMPTLERMQISPPKAREDVARQASVQEQEIALHEAPPEAREEAQDAVEAEKPALDEEGLPVAWVLQVISVSKRDKADSLAQQLVGEGHKAYSRSVERNGEVLYRVYIGPVFDRQQLQKVKRDIDRQLEVQSIISRYVP